MQTSWPTCPNTHACANRLAHPLWPKCAHRRRGRPALALLECACIHLHLLNKWLQGSQRAWTKALTRTSAGTCTALLHTPHAPPRWTAAAPRSWRAPSLPARRHSQAPVCQTTPSCIPLQLQHMPRSCPDLRLARLRMLRLPLGWQPVRQPRWLAHSAQGSHSQQQQQAQLQ